MPKGALYTAAVVFAAVSILHWIRYFTGLEIVIGGTAFPGIGSLILAIIAGVLAAWMVFASREV